jgi:hypothetical protein
VAEVTLGDYTGYIFLEMVKAREMADAYSRAVAERYADDEVLRHFAVPRFKVPRMELTIPVLISGARFRNTVRFDFPREEFVTAIDQRATAAKHRLDLTRGLLPRLGPAASRVLAGSDAIRRLAAEMHEKLEDNPDPSRPDTIVTVMWRQIFRTALGEERLVTYYSEADPRHELLLDTTTEVLDLVRTRTVVDRTAIESLLVDPETHAVEQTSTDSSVFTVNAELLEEAFFLRSVQDEEGGQVRTIVEFD